MKSGMDAELISASRAGQVEAFGRLVEKYESLVTAVAFSATGSRALSDDVAQETFICAWQGLKTLREPEKLKSWLCQIARNVSAKALRSEGRASARARQLSPDALSSTPLDLALEREREQTIWAVLESVPTTYREPLLLFYRHEKSVKEVANVLELSEEAVLQRLSRGRQLLKDKHFDEDRLERGSARKSIAAAVLAAIAVQGSAEAAASSFPLVKVAMFAVAAIALTVGGLLLRPQEQPQTAVAALAAKPVDEKAPLFARITAEAAPEGLRPKQEQGHDFVFEVDGDDGTLWYKFSGGLAQCAKPVLDVAPQSSLRLALEFQPGDGGNHLRSATLSDAALPAKVSRQFQECMTEKFGGELFPAELTHAAASFSRGGAREPSPLADKELVRSVPIAQGPSRGPESAPVTIVAFTDFQCGYCGKILVTLDQLEEEYPGKLRVVVKLLPLKPSSRRLAEAAMAAERQGRFWKMHDLIFAYQDQASLTEADLVDFAKQIGIDGERFQGDLHSDEVRRAVEAHLEEARTIGVNATPTLFINDNQIVGWRPVEVFRSAIDQELSKDSKF